MSTQPTSQPRRYTTSAPPILNPAIPIIELPQGRLQIGHSARNRFSGQAVDAVQAALSNLQAETLPTRNDDLGWEGLRILDSIDALQDSPRPHAWSLRDSPDRARLRGLANSMRSRSSMQLIAARPSVRISVTASTSWAVLEQTLQQLELQISADTSAGDIAVLIGPVGFQRISSLMRNNTPHLAISPRTDSIRVGPLVIPGRSPCLQCLYLARCDRDQDFFRTSLRLENQVSADIDHLLINQASCLAARLVARCADWLSCVRGNATGFEEPLPADTGEYWVVGANTLEIDSRSVARHPRCACWWSQLESSQPLEH